MPEQDPTASILANVIRNRRTINRFQSEPVPTEIIERAIELACWAPNHKLTQPWRYYLPGPVTVARIIELNSEMLMETKGPEAAKKKRESWAQKPGWLVVTYHHDADEIRDKENYAAVCCGLQNLALSLWAEGVGMKWTTGPVTRDDGIYQILNIDRQQEEIVGLIWYGFPDEEPSMKRTPASELTTHLP